MPIKCHWCETNTHSDIDKEQYPECKRVFLTKNEAWAIIGEDKVKNEYHIFLNPRENLLIGTDLPRDEIKDLIQRSKHIELCDAKGEARRMKHGICVYVDSKSIFMETSETMLKAFEELYCA